MNKRISCFADWLKKRAWSFFCTFTTKFKMKLKSARKMMENFFNLITGRKFKVNIFWVAERFRASENYHLHALIEFIERSAERIENGFKAITSVWKIVSKCNENYCTVIRYNSSSGANIYLTKYMNNNDWDVLGDFI